jgi:glutathione S-transferase
VRLYRFRYSCYAWKVQAAVELVGQSVTPVEVPYLDRAEVLRVAPAATSVPVLVLSDGRVLHDSQTILTTLVDEGMLGPLVPAGLEGALWAYSDWCDSTLETPLFQWCTPALRSTFFTTTTERLMYTLIKERKYGSGAVDRWAHEAESLKAAAIRLLGPTCQSLARQPFVLGAQPSLADAALFGQLAMVSVAYPGAVSTLGPGLEAWMQRVLECGVSRP